MISDPMTATIPTNLSSADAREQVAKLVAKLRMNISELQRSLETKERVIERQSGNLRRLADRVEELTYALRDLRAQPGSTGESAAQLQALQAWRELGESVVHSLGALLEATAMPTASPLSQQERCPQCGASFLQHISVPDADHPTIARCTSCGAESWPPILVAADSSDVASVPAVIHREIAETPAPAPFPTPARKPAEKALRTAPRPRGRLTCDAGEWCDRPRVSGGLCQKHALRKNAHGDPLLVRRASTGAPSHRGDSVLWREVGKDQYERVEECDHA